MEREIRIAYRWWRAGGGDIKDEHTEALEETAEDRIRQMMKEGFTSGELKDNIFMTDDDPEDGVEYTGYWETNHS